MRNRAATRGDVSLLFTFMMLMTIILSSLIIGTLVVSRLHGARNAPLSAVALYAADSGIERGYFDFNWNTTSPVCDQYQNVRIGTDPASTTSYDITVSGDRYPSGACPTQAQVQSKGRALCVTALGKAQSGTVFRQLNSDTDATVCGR